MMVSLQHLGMMQVWKENQNLPKYVLSICFENYFSVQRNFFLYKLVLSVLVTEKQSVLETWMLNNDWAPDLK